MAKLKSKFTSISHLKANSLFLLTGPIDWSVKKMLPLWGILKAFGTVSPDNILVYTQRHVTRGQYDGSSLTGSMTALSKDWSR